MKKISLFALILIAGVALTVTAQVLAEDMFRDMGSWTAASGRWTAAGGTLTQSNVNAVIARADRQLPQSGVVQIEFDVMYSDGGFASLEDAMKGLFRGGFGIHVGLDRPSIGRAWGNGRSYLLWLNFDTTVPKDSKHYGFRAQVYQSNSSTDMDVMKDWNVEISSVEQAMALLDQVPGTVFNMRFLINTDTGEVRAYDPTVADYYYAIDLDPARLKGGYVSLRTNRLGLSFSNFRVTKVR